MSNIFDLNYQTLLSAILEDGIMEPNRTGVPAKTLPSWYFFHDFKDGFPILGLRKLPFESVKVELEGFIKGISSKKWYQERGCRFWNDWCNPKKVPYANDDETKAKMRAEDDLGIIYGNNWRAFQDPDCYEGDVIDQLSNIVETLKNNPADRRMLCLAWNPLALEHAALLSCHFSWRIMVLGGKLNLSFCMRSCDTILGFPNNFVSYSILLHLLCLESGYQPGSITAHLDLPHIYENQLGAAQEMVNRTPPNHNPQIETINFKSIFDWTYGLTSVKNYTPGPKMEIPVAV